MRISTQYGQVLGLGEVATTVPPTPVPGSPTFTDGLKAWQAPSSALEILKYTFLYGHPFTAATAGVLAVPVAALGVLMMLNNRR